MPQTAISDDFFIEFPFLISRRIPRAFRFRADFSHFTPKQAEMQGKTAAGAPLAEKELDSFANI